MKKALYVAFSVTSQPKALGDLKVKGLLFCNGNLLSESFAPYIHSDTGNLIFDLPYQIPEGLYTIQIQIIENSGSPVAIGTLTVSRSDFNSTITTNRDSSPEVLQEIAEVIEPSEFTPTEKDRSVGYIIFTRSPLQYIFPTSRPRQSEVINGISTRAVRNKFEPITFALFPLRNLGKVQVSVSDLHDYNNIMPGKKIKIGHIESIRDTTGLQDGYYRRLPALINPVSQAETREYECLRFWLTIDIDDNVNPGTYRGNILIKPQYGKQIKLPLTVSVAPISLEDIPGKDYFMLMTYEFTELSMSWSKEEKAKILQSARNILEDYKKHGMTTLCIHSPFVLISEEDGTANLDDIFAALAAAKGSGFTRPLIWYMGHLIQTAKPKHPGNIYGFDDKVHLARLKYLVNDLTEYAKANDVPPLIFLPIDESDDSYQDVSHKRQKITPLLLKVISDSNAKTMLTARSFSRFQPPDYLCSSELNEQELRAAHGRGSVYWMYNNDVTTKCDNPEYARYIYGYYTWINNIDGMSSWTFQNTQNASGLPANMGGIGKDVYLAYPDPHGPIATLKWEAIREGIDDHKLIYQLIKRVIKLNKRGLDTAKYNSFLEGIRKKAGAPSCNSGDNSVWDADYFKRNRDAIISLILDADRLLELHFNRIN